MFTTYHTLWSHIGAGGPPSSSLSSKFCSNVTFEGHQQGVCDQKITPNLSLTLSFLVSLPLTLFVFLHSIYHLLRCHILVIYYVCSPLIPYPLLPFPRGQKLCLFYSLVYPKYLEKVLAHSSYLLNIG